MLFIIDYRQHTHYSALGPSCCGARAHLVGDLPHALLHEPGPACQDERVLVPHPAAAAAARSASPGPPPPTTRTQDRALMKESRREHPVPPGPITAGPPSSVRAVTQNRPRRQRTSQYSALGRPRVGMPCQAGHCVGQRTNTIHGPTSLRACPTPDQESAPSARDYQPVPRQSDGVGTARVTRPSTLWRNTSVAPVSHQCHTSVAPVSHQCRTTARSKASGVRESLLCRG
jgi:hypothetical protein